jgi:hypothetical protein
LIDIVCKINYKSGIFNKRKMILINAYLIAFIFIVCGAIEFNVGKYFNYDLLTQKTPSILNKGYYPVEIFSDYTDPENPEIITYDEYKNNTFSFSDIFSLILNENVSTRTIAAIINKNTFNSIALRKELAEMLLEYEWSYSSFDNENIEQIIFKLFYNDFESFYTIQYVYTYYFDIKKPELRIHGGPDRQELIKYYHAIDSSYTEAYLSRIASATKISRDIVNRIYLYNDTSNIPDSILNIIKKCSDTIEMSDSSYNIPSRILYFNDIKPSKCLFVYYPFKKVNTMQVNDASNPEDSVFDIRDNSILNRIKESCFY